MPQRFLRPGLRTSPRWNSVSHRAARLYIAILTLVDDYGRYDGRPSVLWAEAFAVWNDQNPQAAVNQQETAADCQQLAAANLVKFHETDGRSFLQVTQWQERVRNKSRWPAPLAVIQQPSAADGCQKLLPSPYPIAISHNPISHIPSPGRLPIAGANSDNSILLPAPNGILLTFLKTQLNTLYQRLPDKPWNYSEENGLFEIMKSPQAEAELAIILAYKIALPNAEKKFFPHTLASLVTHWNETLDRAHSYENNHRTGQPSDGNSALGPSKGKSVNGF